MKKALKMDGKNHPVNNLYDKYGIRKHIQNQPRHSIMRPIAMGDFNTGALSIFTPLRDRLRQSPAEYFNVYTRVVIPQIELRIEERLLHEFTRTLKSNEEKKEVLEAYNMRRHNLSKQKEAADILEINREDNSERRKLSHGNIKQIFSSLDGDGFRYHTFEDVGRFTMFPESFRKRIFPSSYYGRIHETDMEYSGLLSVMAREEGVRLTNEFHRLTLPGERKVDYLKMGSGEMSMEDLKVDVINDYHGYTALQ